MDVLLKVSNHDEFLYQVVHILTLIRGMSMLLMVRASSLPVPLRRINFDRIWPFEFGQLLN